jgi:hypothetical protein
MCYPAWGPNADRHSKSLNQLGLVGSIFGAYSQRLFNALSNRLDAIEKEAFGPNYNREPSTPSLN